MSNTATAGEKQATATSIEKKATAASGEKKTTTDSGEKSTAVSIEKVIVASGTKDTVASGGNVSANFGEKPDVVVVGENSQVRLRIDQSSQPRKRQRLSASPLIQDPTDVKSNMVEFFNCLLLDSDHLDDKLSDWLADLNDIHEGLKIEGVEDSELDFSTYVGIQTFLVQVITLADPNLVVEAYTRAKRADGEFEEYLKKATLE